MVMTRSGAQYDLTIPLKPKQARAHQNTICL